MFLGIWRWWPPGTRSWRRARPPTWFSATQNHSSGMQFAAVPYKSEHYIYAFLWSGKGMGDGLPPAGAPFTYLLTATRGRHLGTQFTTVPWERKWYCIKIFFKSGKAWGTQARIASGCARLKINESDLFQKYIWDIRTDKPSLAVKI